MLRHARTASLQRWISSRGGCIAPFWDKERLVSLWGEEEQKAIRLCRWGGFFGVWEQGSFQHGIYCIPSCSAMASAPLWDSDGENNPKLSGTDRATDSHCLCGMQNRAGRGHGSETH